MKRKRSPSVSFCTRSKKPKLKGGLNRDTKPKSWVAASHVYNYMINDPLVDWLKLISKSSFAILRPRDFTS